MREKTLNEIMSFDRVIRVHEDGTIEENVLGMYAPELHDGELHQHWDSPEWALVSGFSGQYGYSGPLMHQSEVIGGGMEDRIRETPGLWVALVNYCDDDSDPTEWAVAYRPV